jgi:hypothetical protein
MHRSRIAAFVLGTAALCLAAAAPQPSRAAPVSTCDPTSAENFTECFFENFQAGLSDDTPSTTPTTFVGFEAADPAAFCRDWGYQGVVEVDNDTLEGERLVVCGATPDGT